MIRAQPIALVAGLAALVGFGAAVILLREASSGSHELRGSGVAATQARAVPAFQRVELRGSNNVVVRVGRKRAVVVHADDNLLDRVTTKVERGTLVVGNRPGSFDGKSPMTVDVTTPSLRGLTLSGSGAVSVTGIDSPRLSVALPGSGVIRTSGAVRRLVVALGGSGDVQLAQLVAEHASVIVGGSGRADVTATKSLDAAVTGTGAIIYGGNPARLSKDVSGTGAIIGR